SRRRQQARRAPVGRLVKLRRWVVGLLILAVVLSAAYVFWFRDISWFQIRKVSVAGLTTSQAPQIERELERTAKDMTTLHVDLPELRRAVRAYPVVQAINAEPQFPTGLKIGIQERPPGAILETPDGHVMPVAADGTALPGVRAEGIARVSVLELPTGPRVTDPEAQVAVAVAAAAPKPLGASIASIQAADTEPISVKLQNGTELIFGDKGALDEKWAAAAAALADPDIGGAGYIDVTLPDRPVAGDL
ncbi:MAG: cell division protein FtsQ, partial [Thermoleophilaceae bacterium]|nr:cell division protein FtsQ [Thermoleophilaceae bacterium]